MKKGIDLQLSVLEEAADILTVDFDQDDLVFIASRGFDNLNNGTILCYDESARKIGSWRWASDELEALTPEEVVEDVKESVWAIYDPRKKGTGDYARPYEI